MIATPGSRTCTEWEPQKNSLIPFFFPSFLSCSLAGQLRAQNKQTNKQKKKKMTIKKKKKKTKVMPLLLFAV